MFWNLIEKENIGILELDCPDTEVNVLSAKALDELKGILAELALNKTLQALLIASAKPRIFIAGADINEIESIKTKEDAFEKAEAGKEIFKALEDLPFLTVTVINGACLGGGYELALSTNTRVASFSENVKIGLPEAKLGILPGFGGSIRLPRLIGLLGSLPLILGGSILPAQQALSKGLVDRLFPEQTLRENALEYAKEILAKGKEGIRRKKKKTFVNFFMEETSMGRSIVFKKARQNVQNKTKGFYPAPFEIISLIEKTYGDASRESYLLESEHFSRLGTTKESKALIKIFFMSEQYKKFAWTDIKVKSHQVKKCGVVGAGIMGGGIAQLVSAKNIPVRVKDINEDALGSALAEANKIYEGEIKRRKITKYERDRKMALISTGLTHDGFKRCDIVVEAVVENLEIKKKVFKTISEIVSDNTIVASNTSSLSVTEMAKVSKHPDKVVGLHFFNPVDRMPLVEVIRAEQTSDDTLARTVQFARDLGKTVIVTADTAGFLVNRLLLPYLNEAAYLMQEGIGSEIIDQIAIRFGMPMGPIELVDQVGIDVADKVAHILYEAFGERMKVASILDEVKNKGFLGKKSGKGFYIYSEKGKEVNTELSLKASEFTGSEEDLLKRMIYIMINEAARCLDEKVINEASTVDIGMVFGTGFPPFRAGLLHYADEVGLANIVADLKRFQTSIDKDRFEPSPYLVKLAEAGKGFYS